MTQNSDPKVPKILDFQKSAQKVPKFRGDGRTCLEEVQKKGAFFFEVVPYSSPSVTVGQLTRSPLARLLSHSGD